MSWTVLHPRHKLSYFRAQDWEDFWIETALNLVRDEYECSYASVGVNDDDGSDDNNNNGHSVSDPILIFCCLTHASDTSIFNQYI